MIKKKQSFTLLILGFLTNFLYVNAQTKADKFLDITISPSLGFRLLAGLELPQNYTGTRTAFKDSLNKSDRPGQSLNFGVQYMFKQNAYQAFSIGLSYTTLSFRRVRENIKIGDVIHPDLGYYQGVVQAAVLKVKYDYRYQFIELPLLWCKNQHGKTKFKDLDLWYVFGFAPAVLVRHRVGIFTEGFTMNGKNNFSVKDRDSKAVAFNVFLQAAYRAEYHLYKTVHGLVQPRFRLPVLPCSQGGQTVWIPQLSLDLGLIFLLGVK